MTTNEIRARLEAATPGPWVVDNTGVWPGISSAGGLWITAGWGVLLPVEEVRGNAELIAHAPTDAAALYATEHPNPHKEAQA